MPQIQQAVTITYDLPNVAYGFDASMRHGSLVKLEKATACGHIHYAWTEVFKWGKKSEGFGTKAPYQEIGIWAMKVVESLKGHPEGPVIIEFDPNSVYWRAGKRQIVTFAYFLGSVASELAHQGFPSIFVTPREIRSCFGFTKGDKETFHHHFLDLIDDHIIIPTLDDLIGTDTLDAFTMALMYFELPSMKKLQEGGPWELPND